MITPSFFPTLPRVTVSHDVIRLTDGEVVGVIESTWQTETPDIFALDGIPSGASLRGAMSYGAVPQGVLDDFCGVYGEAAAAVRRAYRFAPRG